MTQCRRRPRAFDDACRRWRDLYRLALQEFHTQSDALGRRQRPAARTATTAARRARDARIQLTLLSNEDSDDFQTDFYSYRYFASEGFLPGYSFPRLPLAAYIPGLAGSTRRRLHAAAAVHRASASSAPAPSSITRAPATRSTSVSPAARRTRAGRARSPRRPGAAAPAATYHPEAVGIDVCEHCAEPLHDTTRSLLRLHTGPHRRRDRISTDEEERRRAGFELQTSYRFGHHGGKPGRIDATASDEKGLLLSLAYGDSATVRVTNLGRRRRQKPDVTVTDST